MEKPYIKLKISEPPEELCARVVSRVHLLERRREKRRAGTFWLVALSTFAGALVACKSAIDSATQSGFARYASLAFSDWSIVANMWKTFALSLAETAPLFSVVLFTAMLLVFAWSLGQALRYGKAARLSFR